MDDTPRPTLPDDIDQLKSLIAQRDDQLHEQRTTIAALAKERDAFYLETLRLQVRLDKALKQAYGPRADRLRETGQMLLDFGEKLDALPAHRGDVPPEEEADEASPRSSRRIRTRGRRDIGSLNNLPMIEQEYKLEGELCQCPNCQRQRDRIGEQISYTIEHVPAQLLRIKHIQYKYACRHCEHDGHSPQIELAEKTNGSPIDKGMPGPGLLAYVATSKYADYLPLHRLQTIFERQGFELDRSTMCLWMADVARLVRPIYDRMCERVRQSHVLATDDTVMPLLQPGRTRQARMWIYHGDETGPYNVFDFTVSRGRDGPKRFLAEFSGVLLADAYGGYDGIVLDRDLPRAGCWSHARRKFVQAEKTAPELARRILRLIDGQGPEVRTARPRGRGENTGRRGPPGTAESRIETACRRAAGHLRRAEGRAAAQAPDGPGDSVCPEPVGTADAVPGRRGGADPQQPGRAADEADRAAPQERPVRRDRPRRRNRGHPQQHHQHLPPPRHQPADLPHPAPRRPGHNPAQSPRRLAP